MKKRIGDSTSGEKITVLSIGPIEEDHASLSRILAASTAALCPGSQWNLESASTLPEALSVLNTARPAVVVCEAEIPGGSWRDVWVELAALPDPPFLIVASRLADEYLWAEALNLGAYDVLGKPYDPAEVARSLSQAWLRRTYRQPRKPGLAAVGRSQSDSRVAV